MKNRRGTPEPRQVHWSDCQALALTAAGAQKQIDELFEIVVGHPSISDANRGPPGTEAQMQRLVYGQEPHFGSWLARADWEASLMGFVVRAPCATARPSIPPKTTRDCRVERPPGRAA